METQKKSTRPVMVRVLFFNLLAGAGMIAAAYWLLEEIATRTAALSQAHPDLAQGKALSDWVEVLSRGFWPYGVPALTLFFVLMALWTWWSLRRLFLTRSTPVPARRPAAVKSKTQAATPPQGAESDPRLYLHLVAVLQKEGRLLDFFSEDLAQYNDGQIGAAVRSIHESCKKALDRHIAPQFVLEAQEGDEIAVQKDFDPNTLKLVGNVTGEPPFNGIVRHRGWRARKVDLPTFSGRQPADIIAPAEIEVR